MDQGTNDLDTQLSKNETAYTYYTDAVDKGFCIEIPQDDVNNEFYKHSQRQGTKQINSDKNRIKRFEF